MAKSKPTTIVATAGKDGVKKGMTNSQALAAMATRSALTATVVKAYAAGDSDVLDLSDLMDEMREAGRDVNRNDLTRVEAMLASQALALEAVFNNLALRAIKADHIPRMETYLKLALKAQSQCRATIETLATIKSPPVVIAKQANVTTGPQQINNGAAKPSRTREIETEQSKLLEDDHGQRMDTRTTGTAGGTDPVMETVGALDRPAHR